MKLELIAANAKTPNTEVIEFIQVPFVLKQQQQNQNQNQGSACRLVSANYYSSDCY